MRRRFAIALAALLLLGSVVGLLTPWGREILGLDSDGAGGEPAGPAAMSLEAAEGRAASGPSLGVPPAARAATGGSSEVLPPPVDLGKADRDLDLFGVVVTSEGIPIAGADLVTVTYPVRRGNLVDYARYHEAVEGPRTRSAIDGTFSLRLSRGARVALRVAAKGRARFERPGCTAGQRLRVVLGPGVSLVVALVDEGGQPAPNERVRLFRPELAGEAAFERMTTSDERGLARFEELPGAVWAWVDPKPTRLGGRGWQRVELPVEGEARLELVLPTGRTVTGRVTDAESKQPIGGAKVGINWVLDRPVVTDADGRYEVPGWNNKQGAEDLHVVAEAYGGRAAIVGERDVVDFALERGDEVVGRVVDASAGPVKGALVAVVAIGGKAGSNEGDTLPTTTAGPDGRFRLTSLRRDQDHALVVMAPGFGRYLLDFAPRTPTAGEIDLGDVVLPAARAIEGRVVEGDASPAEGVRVVLSGANGDRRRRMGDQPFSGTGRYGQTEEALTDDLGRFRFPDLASGKYTLRASRSGSRSVSLSVDLPVDQDVLDAVLSFAIAREVVVEVRDESGGGLAGVHLSAQTPNGGEGVGAQTDSAGEALLRLTEGTWSVSVLWNAETDPKGRHLAPIIRHPLPVGVDRVMLTLLEAHTISGRVLGLGGEAVPQAMLEAVRGDEVVAWARAGRDGSFTMELPEGPSVTVRLTGRILERGLVSLMSGEERGVEVGARDVIVRVGTMRTDRAISLVVLSPEGEPVAGVSVHAHTASGQSHNAMTDGAGRATFSNLTAERHWIAALPTPSHVADWLPASAEVPEPSGQAVDVRFQRGASVSGVVVDAQGRPVAEVEIQALAKDVARVLAHSASDAQGRFRLAVPVDVAVPFTVRTVSQSASLGGTIEVRSVPAEGLSIVVGVQPGR